MKKLGLFLLIAALALPLAGCGAGVHGGGKVTVLYGNMEGIEEADFQLGIATFAISAMCSDGKDAFMSSIEWNDPANGRHFHARQPWTPVSEFNGMESCEELATALGAMFPGLTGAVAAGLVSEQGQRIGDVTVYLLAPGQDIPLIEGQISPIEPDACGETAATVMITGSGSGFPHYTAIGCLERGNLVFQ